MNSSTLASDISVFNSVPTSVMNTTQDPLRHIEEFDWILSNTIVVTLIASTIWVFVSLIHYGIRNRLWNKKPKNKHVINSGKIYTCVVILACMCLIFFITSMVGLNVGYNDNETNICIIIKNLNISSYLLAFTSVGCFLWFRQRSFYVNQFLNVNYNKVIKKLSFVSIFIMIGISLLVWILVILLFDAFITSSPRGCVLHEKRIPVLSEILNIYWILVTCCIILVYSVLLALLSYALLSIKSVSFNNVPNTSRCTVNNVSENVQSMQTRNNIQRFKFLKIKSIFLNNKTCKNKNSLQQKILVLKRILLFGVLSVASYVVSHIVIFYYVNSDGDFKISLVILNIDAFLQLLFVILSFTTYKKMLTSLIVICSA